MGNYLSKPEKGKICENGENESIRFASCTMQGWRIQQEDAHNCIIDYGPKVSYFSVYDGHGGTEVSQYLSRHFPDYLKQRNVLLTGPDNIGEELKKLFVEFDATLREEETVKNMSALKEAEKGSLEVAVNPEEAEQKEKETLMEEAVALSKEAKVSLDEILKQYVKCRTIVIENMQGDGESRGSKRRTLAYTTPQALKRQKTNKGEPKAVATKVESKDESQGQNGPEADGEERPPENGKPDEDGEGDVPALDDGNAVNGGNSLAKTAVNASAAADEECASKENNGKAKSGGKKRGGDFDEGSQKEEGEEEVARTAKQQPSEAADSSSTATAVADSVGQRVKPSTSGDGQNAGETAEGAEEDEEEDDPDFNVEEEEEQDSDDEEEEGPEAADDEEEEGEEGAVAEDGAEDEEEEEEEEFDEDDIGTLLLSSEPGTKAGFDSGSTACVAFIFKERIVVANIGDSRAVLFRAGKALDLSSDHKPEDEEEKRRIQAAGGKVGDDGRVNGGLNLSRAFGDHFYKQKQELPLEEQMITPLPDVTITSRDGAQDEFLVIACDGIWNSMTSQQACDFIAQRIGQKGLQEIVEEICEHCCAKDTAGDGSGCDNETVILIDLKKNQRPAISSKGSACASSVEGAVAKEEAEEVVEKEGDGQPEEVKQKQREEDTSEGENGKE